MNSGKFSRKEAQKAQKEEAGRIVAGISGFLCCGNFREIKAMQLLLSDVYYRIGNIII
jgi:hypothetical protein